MGVFLDQDLVFLISLRKEMAKKRRKKEERKKRKKKNVGRLHYFFFFFIFLFLAMDQRNYLLETLFNEFGAGAICRGFFNHGVLRKDRSSGISERRREKEKRSRGQILTTGVLAGFSSAEWKVDCEIGVLTSSAPATFNEGEEVLIWCSPAIKSRDIKP